MRIRIAALFLGCVALTAPRAWAQAPGQPPPAPPGMAGPGAPPGPPGMTAGPSAVPGPGPGPGLQTGLQTYPPPGWSPPGAPPGTAFAPPPMVVPPAAPAPAEVPQIQVNGRVGFGVGVYVAPGGGSSGASGALGGLGALSSYGGALGVRWWVKERLVVLPSLNLSISHATVPNTEEYGTYIQGSSFTNGSVEPTILLGYAAYRGKSTRFLLLGGVGFGYAAQEQIKNIPSTGTNGSTARYVTAKTVSFTVPFGFALEQFFTSRISVVVGAQAPLFEYFTTKVGFEEAYTKVGANFRATQLGASIFFYTD